MAKNVFENVLHIVDGSDASVKAGKYAIMLTKIYKCNLTSIYVVDTAALKELLMTKIFIEDESAEYEKSLEENGQRYLNYMKELADKKNVKIDTILEHGSGYGTILEIAMDKNIDLIVIGGKEGGFRNRDMLSVETRRLLNSSKCPVLIVRDEYIEKKFNKL